MSDRASTAGAVVARALGDRPGVCRLLDRAVDLAPSLDGAAALQGDGSDGADTTDSPTPDVAVVWCADGTTSVAERRGLLARAAAVLPPGGRVVVVASVVGGPDGDNPTVHELYADLLVATAGETHVDDVVSVRWPGEALVRGVVVVATSLRGRADL